MTVPVPGSLIYIDNADGVTTSFSYPVRFLDKTEIVVLLRDDTGDTVQVLGTDYTIAGSSWPTGGNVVFNVAPPTGKKVVRYRNTTAKQLVDLENTQRNDAGAVETQLDRLAMVQQDQGRDIARSLKLPAGADPLPEGHFPVSDGEGGVKDGGDAGDIADAEANAAAAAADRALAEAARDAALAGVPNVFPLSKAAMAALFGTATLTAAYLNAPGLEGQFFKSSSDLSAVVALDTKQGIVVPNPADPTGASGGWVRRIGYEVMASWFDTVGDDTADDTEAWQVAAKFSAGRTLCGENGKTYNLTDEVALPDGCTLDLRQSRMNFRVSGAVRCVSPGNNCRVMNGWIKNFGTEAVSGDDQCPIAIGDYGANTGVSNVHCLNLTIESAWSDGNGIIVTGDSSNVIIENITFPDGPLYCPILVHWSGTTAGTKHPHDVAIRNIKCGDINADGYLVSLSSCYNILVENVSGGTCYFGFHNYAGDYTNMYAPADIKPLVGNNIIARNIVATDVREAGIYVDGQSFNPDIVSPPTTPIPMNGIIENCRFIGAGGIAQVTEPTATYGMQIANCQDLEIRNNFVSWFVYGIVPAGATERVAVVGNLIRSMSNTGIVVSFSASAPIDWTVERNALQGNNRAGNTNDLGAAILVGNSRNCKVVGNRVGFASSEFSQYGVRVTDDAVAPVLRDNWVETLSAGGTAYSVGTLTSYAIKASGENNRAAAGITLWGGATLLNDYGGGKLEGIAFDNAAPSSGTWSAGDRLWSAAPTSTVVGFVCTTGGTPGTWRSFGT